MARDDQEERCSSTWPMAFPLTVLWPLLQKDSRHQSVCLRVNMYQADHYIPSGKLTQKRRSILSFVSCVRSSSGTHVPLSVAVIFFLQFSFSLMLSTINIIDSSRSNTRNARNSPNSSISCNKQTNSKNEQTIQFRFKLFFRYIYNRHKSPPQIYRSFSIPHAQHRAQSCPQACWLFWHFWRKSEHKMYQKS